MTVSLSGSDDSDTTGPVAIWAMYPDVEVPSDVYVANWIDAVVSGVSEYKMTLNV